MAGGEMQVRKFVEEVWNGRNYQAVFDLYGDNYVNPFGTGPASRAKPIRRYHQAFPCSGTFNYSPAPAGPDRQASPTTLLAAQRLTHPRNHY